MGRYNVRSNQDLSGIATLTNDPIAIDNIRSVARLAEKKLEMPVCDFQESMVIPNRCKNPKLLHLPE